MDKKTIDRIRKNEERLDNINTCIKNVENALEKFKKNKKNINMLNKYYGSANWFKDKEAYEKNEIPRMKAGVLSEDAVWNMNDDIKELILEMKLIVNKFLNV